MDKPPSPSARAGSSPATHETVSQAQEHHDRNVLMPHPYMTQHNYPYHHHPPLTSDYDENQQGHYHPPAWQTNSEGPSPNRPQSTAPIQHNSTQNPPFSGRTDQQTFDHQTHPTLHSTKPVAPPPTRSHPTTHWEQNYPSNQTDASHANQRSLPEYDHNSAPQWQASQETHRPPTGLTIRQISFRSVESGADEIGGLMVGELVKMRVHFEGLIGEMRKQLAREQEEKDSLKKRVHELEKELLQLHRVQ